MTWRKCKIIGNSLKKICKFIFYKHLFIFWLACVLLSYCICFINVVQTFPNKHISCKWMKKFSKSLIVQINLNLSLCTRIIIKYLPMRWVGIWAQLSISNLTQTKRKDLLYSLCKQYFWHQLSQWLMLRTLVTHWKVMRKKHSGCNSRKHVYLWENSKFKIGNKDKKKNYCIS